MRDFLYCINYTLNVSYSNCGTIAVSYRLLAFIRVSFNWCHNQSLIALWNTFVVPLGVWKYRQSIRLRPSRSWRMWLEKRTKMYHSEPRSEASDTTCSKMYPGYYISYKCYYATGIPFSRVYSGFVLSAPRTHSGSTETLLLHLLKTY